MWRMGMRLDRRGGHHVFVLVHIATICQVRAPPPGLEVNSAKDFRLTYRRPGQSDPFRFRLRRAVVTEDTLLADAATRVVLRPKLDAVVAVDAAGRVTGIVSAADLTTACDRSALGLPVERRLRQVPPTDRWIA
ncbi:hypothetical protein EBN03_10850 [Nocardia stercoris]|uniref:CBS domain-containing protein n=1 Tax=Nocardia stercoris TaxID=2483361 RepID=A0A3M2LAK0_9NOCA|nr:hypothetical protein EBN03_10850 [Nocardia stercoris]